jgi:hypothetical protein
MKRRHTDDDASADTRATGRRSCTTAAEAEAAECEATHDESLHITIAAAMDAPTTAAILRPAVWSSSAAAASGTVSSRVGSAVVSHTTTAAAAAASSSEQADARTRTHDPDVSMSDVVSRDDIDASSLATDVATVGSSAAVADSIVHAPAIDAPLHVARTRRNPHHSACHMDELITDEMQCVMQLLDVDSLLRFARCSRRLLSDADSDIAWKYQPAYDIKFTCEGLSIGARIRHSLLRHAPATSVDWSGSYPYAWPTDEEVSALLRIPRMTRLVISHCPTEAQLCRIMDHSALDSLTELLLEGVPHLPFDFVDHLVRLASLTSIRVLGSLPHLDPLTALPRLSKLTTLQLGEDDWGPAHDHRRIDAIAQCAHLTDLYVHGMAISGPQFRQFFTSSVSHQLQRVTLNYSFPRGRAAREFTMIPAEDYIAAFQSLHQLRFLCFIFTNDVDDMLEHLHHAPALQTLEIRVMGSPLAHHAMIHGERTWPSVAVLQQLIHRTTTSELHITIVPIASARGRRQTSSAHRYAALDPSRFTYHEV